MTLDQIILLIGTLGGPAAIVAYLEWRDKRPLVKAQTKQTEVAMMRSIIDELQEQNSKLTKDMADVKFAVVQEHKQRMAERDLFKRAILAERAARKQDVDGLKARVVQLEGENTELRRMNDLLRRATAG